jgi:hypothetical protein
MGLSLISFSLLPHPNRIRLPSRARIVAKPVSSRIGMGAAELAARRAGEASQVLAIALENNLGLSLHNYSCAGY